SQQFRRGLPEVAQPEAKKSPRDPQKDAQIAAYQAQVAAFREQVKRRQLQGLEHFYWYHTVDLGDGLVTPGDYDLRPHLADYHFPESMHGMTVLDVGSATGFFAFEFERRGANVISVELPSIAEWDMIWSERENLLNS